MVLGQLGHGITDDLCEQPGLNNLRRVRNRGRPKLHGPVATVFAAQVVDHLVTADVEDPGTNHRFPAVAQSTDRSHRRHEGLLCHVFSSRPVAEARERIGVDVRVETFEQSVPPSRIAASCCLYSPGE